MPDAKWLVSPAVVAAEAEGQPYYYGKGSPSMVWPGEGDCSGQVQGAAVRGGVMSINARDRTADQIYRQLCREVLRAEVEPGDLVAYGSEERISHIGLVTEVDGDTIWCYGANGGRSTTKGDDSSAYFRRMSADYRSDLIGFGRLQTEATGLEVEDVLRTLCVELYRLGKLSAMSSTFRLTAAKVLKAASATYPTLIGS